MLKNMYENSELFKNKSNNSELKNIVSKMYATGLIFTNNIDYNNPDAINTKCGNGQTLLMKTIINCEYVLSIELIKMGADLKITDYDNKNCFDILCSSTFNRKYIDNDMFLYLIDLMGKTADEVLLTNVKYNNPNNLDYIFSIFKPSQESINTAFALACDSYMSQKLYYYGESIIKNSTIMSYLVKKINNITDDSLNFIINKNIDVALKYLLSSDFFDINRITAKQLLSIASSYNNYPLIEQICTNNPSMANNDLLLIMCKNESLEDIKTFMKKFNIYLIDWNNLDIVTPYSLINSSIENYDSNVLVYILDLFKYDLKDYKCLKPIPNSEMMRILLKYNYEPSPNDFNFDNLTMDTELLYEMVKRINNPNLMFAIILSKLGDLTNEIDNLKSKE